MQYRRVPAGVPVRAGRNCGSIDDRPACPRRGRRGFQTAPEMLGVRIPDSDVALAAAALMQTAAPLFLFNHCLRTFLLGMIDAHKRSLNVDHEVVFVACTTSRWFRNMLDPDGVAGMIHDIVLQEMFHFRSGRKYAFCDPGNTQNCQSTVFTELSDKHFAG
jgi:hypothetical protein